ncbi:DUF1885 family protein [Bacillus sp. IB182487]|uniref:DUF1885 family protein n=1 Tax=Metabacillus arenae TaxID=2771434 RepID=A0A926NG29_9BACI|nr:DUF1885 family protein [Metabacillus arenae]MBD1380904.1 DUF1885 family protein [Metabacillus arenae]
MASYAFIKLGEADTGFSREDLLHYIQYYKEITSKTGQQLDWGYENAAFPYDVDDVDDHLVLASKERGYYKIFLSVQQKDENEQKHTYIQVFLPEKATHGDKGKANEFCKFIAKKVKGELHLFSGKVMSFNKK